MALELTELTRMPQFRAVMLPALESIKSCPVGPNKYIQVPPAPFVATALAVIVIVVLPNKAIKSVG